MWRTRLSGCPWATRFTSLSLGFLQAPFRGGWGRALGVLASVQRSAQQFPFIPIVQLHSGRSVCKVLKKWRESLRVWRGSPGVAVRVCATRLAPSVRTRSGAASQAGTPSRCSPHRPPLLRTSAPGPGPQLPCTPCPPASGPLPRRLSRTLGPARPATPQPAPAPSPRRSGTRPRPQRGERGAGRGEEAAGLTVPRRFQFPSKRHQP